MKICLVPFLAAAVLPASGFAQNGPAQPFDMSYGFGLVGTSGVYVGQEDELFAFPLVVLSHGKWTLSVPQGVRFLAIGTDATRLAFSLLYDPVPDMPDTALFAGLKRVDGAAVGMEISHDFSYFDVAAAIKRNVTTSHNGISGDVSLGKSVAMGSVFVEGRVGATFRNGSYGTYHYGVAKSEANGLRGAYEVSASWSPYLDVAATVPINDVTSIIGGFRHEQLSKEISRSPLVGTPEATTFSLSLVRQF